MKKLKLVSVCSRSASICKWLPCVITATESLQLTCTPVDVGVYFGGHFYVDVHLIGRDSTSSNKNLYIKSWQCMPGAS